MHGRDCKLIGFGLGAGIVTGWLMLRVMQMPACYRAALAIEHIQGKDRKEALNAGWVTIAAGTLIRMVDCADQR